MVKDRSVVVQCEDIDDDFRDVRRKFSLKTTLPEVENSEDFLGRIRKYNEEGPHIIEGFHHENQQCPNLKVRRLIKKNGKYNVLRSTESNLAEKYLRDFFNTLVQMKWWKIILASSSVFILCWLTFGIIWMLISTSNGDLEDDIKNPCIVGVKNFAGYFLFSLETQVSIGYGTRSITEECLEAALVLCIQLIVGIFVCGVTVNVVYMKIVKPSSRFSNNLFSNHAVVSRRDGHLCLIFRVRDEEHRHTVATTITAYILRKEISTGEPYLEVLNLEPYGFLIWPLEIVHRITPKSPLWDISSYNLISDKFEIIVTLQGSSASTGQCSKTRTSFVSSEILWGYKFKNCIRYNKRESMYDIQRKNFNETIEFATHLCSAKKFCEVYRSTMTPTPSISRNHNNLKITLPQRKEEYDVREEETERREERKKLEDGGNRNSNFPIISNIDDSWMKESKSMPAIIDFEENASLGGSKNYNSYADYLTNKKYETLHNRRKNSNDKHRVFEEHNSYDMPFSVNSIDYPKSDIDDELDVDLHTMLTSLEDYLDKHSSHGNSILSLFPKD